MLAPAEIVTMRDSVCPGLMTGSGHMPVATRERAMQPRERARAHWRHRPRPGSYAREGVCMRLEQRHAEFTTYMPKKHRQPGASARRGLPGVTCRNWPEGEQYDRGSGPVSS
jgi:hypothetical protein